MTKPPLTRAQQLAMAKDRNLSVIAGAGTGKTHVLSERFLDILQRHRTVDWKDGSVACPPAGLVAMTFTRKAAGEMHERIATDLSKRVTVARDAGDAEGFAYWTRMRRRLGDARITTIHGLCTDIVLDHALLLGLDPESAVLDAPEQKALAEEALDETLRDPPEEARSDLVALVTDSTVGEVRKALTAILQDHVFAAGWSHTMATLDIEAYLRQVTHAVAPCSADEARERLAAICGHIEGVVHAPVQPDGEKAAAFLAACRTLLADREEQDDHKVLRTYCRFIALFRTADGKKMRSATRGDPLLGTQKDWEPTGDKRRGIDLYQALYQQVQPDAERHTKLPDETDQRLLEQMRALALTLIAAKERYDEKKKRRRALDYSDLERHALRVLEGPFGVLDEVRARIRHLMVDEFQDTNEVQWRIIRLLAAQGPGPDGEPLWLEDGEMPPEPGLDEEGFITAGEMFGIETDPDVDIEAAQVRTPAAEPFESHGDAKHLDAAHLGAPHLGVPHLETSDLHDPVPHSDEDPLLAADRLFIVGDAKQSIYSFRGADVSVYQASRAALKTTNRHHGTDEVRLTLQDGTPTEPQDDESLGEVRLDENFRSLPHLVHFANHLFGGLMRPATGTTHAPYEAEPGPLTPKRVRLDDQEAGQIHLLAVPDASEGYQSIDHPGAADALLRTPKENAYLRLAEHIRNHIIDANDLPIEDPNTKQVRPATVDDVAILMASRTHLKTLERALAGSGIPYVVSGGRGFWVRQEIWDHLNLLTFLADPHDDVALAGLLRSPFFAWTDDAVLGLALTEGNVLWQRLENIAQGDAPWTPPVGFAGMPPVEVYRLLDEARRAAGTAPTHRIVRRIHDATGSPAALAAEERPGQAHANVEKLLRLIRDREARQGIHLPRLVRDFARYVDEGTDEAEAPVAEGSAGVRILTIHSAKGLEYPVLYLPDLDRPFPTENLGEARGYRKGRLFDVPLVTTKMPDADGEQIDPALHGLLAAQAKERTRAEQARLLYVAVTRARDHLVMVTPTPLLFPKDPAKGQPPARDHARCFRDWIEDALGIDATTYHEAYASPGHSRSLQIGETEITIHTRPPMVETPATMTRTTVAPTSPETTTGPLTAPVIPQRHPPIVIHPSAIETYLVCPAKFRHRHLEHLPDLRVRGTALSHPERGMLLGSAVHRVLELTHDEEAIPQVLEARLAAMAEDHGFPADGFLRDVRAHVAKARTTLTRDAAEQDPTGAVLKELAIDHAWAEGVRTRGVIDRLVHGPDGWTVIDTKADRPKDALQHGHETGHDAQVALYTSAVKDRSGAPAKGALLYTSTGQQVPVPPDGVIPGLQGRLQETRRLDRTSARDRDAELAALWPRTPKTAETCDGCGFYARYGGPCKGAVVSPPSDTDDQVETDDTSGPARGVVTDARGM